MLQPQNYNTLRRFLLKKQHNFDFNDSGVGMQRFYPAPS
jgi:hypothetical protein